MLPALHAPATASVADRRRRLLQLPSLRECRCTQVRCPSYYSRDAPTPRRKNRPEALTSPAVCYTEPHSAVAVLHSPDPSPPLTSEYDAPPRVPIRKPWQSRPSLQNVHAVRH